MTRHHQDFYMTRFVPTFINKEGNRQMIGPMQGRSTYATSEKAQAWIDAMKANNSDMLKGLYGDLTKIEVRPVICYPGHFDPITIWFED